MFAFYRHYLAKFLQQLCVLGTVITIPFYRCRNQGSARGRDLLKAALLISGERAL